MCRFKATSKKSAFVELTSFKSSDSEVPSFYFGSVFFSVIDRNDFEMTEKIKVISVKMSENIGEKLYYGEF